MGDSKVAQRISDIRSDHLPEDISSGAAELEPIFRAILEKATGLCDAEIGNIYRWDGDALYLVAAHNAPPAFEELRRRSPAVLDTERWQRRMTDFRARFGR